MARKGGSRNQAPKMPMSMGGAKGAHMMTPAETKKMMGGKPGKKK